MAYSFYQLNYVPEKEQPESNRLQITLPYPWFAP